MPQPLIGDDNVVKGRGHLTGQRQAACRDDYRQSLDLAADLATRLDT